MRVLAAALLFIAAAAPCSAADPVLTATEFRDAMARAIEASTGHAPEIVDEKAFKVRTSEGEGSTVFVDNAYEQYLAEPSRRDEIIARFVRVFGKDVDDETSDLGQLVIVVRPSDYVTASLAPGSNQANFLPPRAMAGDMSFFLAVDSPETIRTADRDDLARWNLDEAAAWAVAEANIVDRVGELATIQLGDENGPVGFVADSGLGPSILADPSFCGSGESANGEGWVVLIHARDMFLFAPPGETELIDRFWRAAKTEIAEGRSLSKTPLTCQNGHWEAAKAA